jgi:hypothetical protein
MKAKFIIAPMLSILIGLYISIDFSVLSGVSPFLNGVLAVLFLIICISILILIVKEPIMKVKMTQAFILLLALVFGFYTSKKLLIL